MHFREVLFAASQDAASSESTTADLLIVAGQSNAVGRDNGIPAPLLAVDNVETWTGTAFEALAPGVNNSAFVGAEDDDTFGPELQFALRYGEDNPGKTLYLFKYAIGATRLAADTGDDWNTASTGEYWDTLVTEAGQAVTAIGIAEPGATIRVTVIWMQGEADANNATYAPLYQDNLEDLIDACESELDASKVIIGRINVPDYPHRLVVRQAQVDAVAAKAIATLVNTDGYVLDVDDIHYAADGQVDFGEDCYDAFLGAYTFSDATPEAFSFSDLTGQALDTQVTSGAITVTDIAGTVTASLATATDAEFEVYQADGTTVVRAWGTASASVSAGQKIKLRMTSSDLGTTAQTATLTVGGVSDEWSVTTGAGGGYTAEAEAYFARMSSQPDATLKGHVDQLILDLQAAGSYSKFDCIVLEFMHDAQASKLNLVDDQYDLTDPGTTNPAHTAFQGFTGDGTTDYLSTNFNPITATTPKFVLNDAHMGVWLGTNVTGSATDFGGTNNRINARSAGNMLTASHVNANDSTALPVATSVGWTCWSRDNASTYKLVKDNNTPATVTRTTVAIQNLIFLVMAAGSTPSAFSTRRAMIAHWGASFDDDQQIADTGAAFATFVAAVAV